MDNAQQKHHLCQKLEEIFMTFVPTDDVIDADPVLSREVETVNRVVNDPEASVESKLHVLLTFNEGHIPAELPLDERMLYLGWMYDAKQLIETN